MKQLLVALGVALAAALIIGPMDRHDAEATAKRERIVAEKKADVRPVERFELSYRDGRALSHPVGCGQIFAKRGADEHWRIYSVCADFTQRAEQ